MLARKETITRDGMGDLAGAQYHAIKALLPIGFLSKTLTNIACFTSSRILNAMHKVLGKLG
jgi:hypothetical protein